MADRFGKKRTCSIYEACSAAHYISHVMVAVRWKGNWLFLRRKAHRTYEFPGGRVRGGESPFNAVRRELFEKAGVIAGKIYPICYYSCSLSPKFSGSGPIRESYGRLYYAEALRCGTLPGNDTEELRFDGWIPEEKQFSYPELQAPLFRKAVSWYRNACEHGVPDNEAFFFEKVCGVIPTVYRNRLRHYLIIKNLSGHIGFPKGHAENGESEQDTALREMREETGLSLSVKPGFRYTFTYSAHEHGCRMHKTAVYFTAEFAPEDEALIRVQPEEILGQWILPFEEAAAMLNKPNDRAMLTEAERFWQQTEK